MKKNKNNWYVITGGPCSGKTTILDLLKEKKYKVVYEAARWYIDEEMKKGRTLREIRKDEYKFQKEVLKLKIKIEKSLPLNKLTFIERGIPDTSAYYSELCNITDDKFLKKSLKKCNYKKVFLFEMLNYKKDYARVENSKEAIKLEKALEKSYSDLGFEVIKVPRMSIEKRISFIEKNIK